MSSKTFALPGETPVEYSLPLHRTPRETYRDWCRTLLWRTRWFLWKNPWKIQMGDGSAILASRTSRNELVYRFGYSEPSVARFLWGFLKPGMTFWDVGAHVGELSLLAASRLGSQGSVRAVEPHPKFFDLLSHNLRDVPCRVHVARKVVTAEDGSADIVIEHDTAHLRATPQEASHEWLPSVTLDQLSRQSNSVPNLIRVNTHGAERFALEGSTRLLDLPADEAPVWIMPYQSKQCETYGYSPRYLVAEFGCCGYSVSWLTEQGLAPASLRNLPEHGDCNLVAVKREAGFRG